MLILKESKRIPHFTYLKPLMNYTKISNKFHLNPCQPSHIYQPIKTISNSIYFNRNKIKYTLYITYVHSASTFM